MPQFFYERNPDLAYVYETLCHVNIPGIIGQGYVPFCNSFSYSLEDGVNHLLHGKLTTVISQPYLAKVTAPLYGPVDLLFVTVVCQELYHRHQVMFRESNLQPYCLLEDISSIAEDLHGHLPWRNPKPPSDNHDH
jgi:hypothetical protein